MKLHKWLKYSLTKELVDYIKTGKLPEWVERAPSTTKWKDRCEKLEGVLYDIARTVDYKLSQRYQEFIKLANSSSDEYHNYVMKKVCPVIEDISSYAHKLKKTLFDRHAYIRKEYKSHHAEILDALEDGSNRYKAAEEILNEETMFIETKLQNEVADYIKKFEQYCINKLMPLINSLELLPLIEVPRNYHKTFSDYIKSKRSYTDANVIKVIKNEL